MLIAHVVLFVLKVKLFAALKMLYVIAWGSYLKNAAFKVLFPYNLQVEGDNHSLHSVVSGNRDHLETIASTFRNKGVNFQAGAHMFENKPNI